MNPFLNHQFEVRFKAVETENTSFEFHLLQIQKFLSYVSDFDPSLKYDEWLIATGVRETSYLYSVFDKVGPTETALAVLGQESQKNDVVKSLTLWNGQEDRAKGASITCIFGRQDGVASSFNLSIRSPRSQMRLGGWMQVSEALGSAVKTFTPIYGSVETMYYQGVFKDRPGVGWMLYLPHILTDQQIPEARALVPVMGTGDEGKEKQIGTIIVSVTDAPFSDENPEHVKIAHAIEIRLVDQDLLPRFIDL
jgi:hypothetical protein